MKDRIYTCELSKIFRFLCISRSFSLLSLFHNHSHLSMSRITFSRSFSLFHKQNHFSTITLTFPQSLSLFHNHSHFFQGQQKQACAPKMENTVALMKIVPLFCGHMKEAGPMNNLLVGPRSHKGHFKKYQPTTILKTLISINV